MNSFDPEPFQAKNYNFSDSWVKGLHEVSKDINASASDINYLAQALIIVGNSELAHKLFDIADKIHFAGKGIDNFIGYKLDSDLRQTQESSSNILRACLGTLEAATQKDKK